jgi:hypothetical protein
MPTSNTGETRCSICPHYLRQHLVHQTSPASAISGHDPEWTPSVARSRFRRPCLEASAVKVSALLRRALDICVMSQLLGPPLDLISQSAPSRARASWKCASRCVRHPRLELPCRRQFGASRAPEVIMTVLSRRTEKRSGHGFADRIAQRITNWSTQRTMGVMTRGEAELPARRGGARPPRSEAAGLKMPRIRRFTVGS